MSAFSQVRTTTHTHMGGRGFERLVFRSGRGRGAFGGSDPPVRVGTVSHRPRVRASHVQPTTEHRPLEDNVKQLAKSTFKLIQAVHHKTIIDRAIQTQTPPVGMQKHVKKLTSFIRPSSPTEDVRRAVESHTSQWLMETLNSLRSHYNDIIQSYRSVPFSETAFTVAVGWAEKRYRTRLDPNTPAEVQNILEQCDEPTHISDSQHSSLGSPAVQATRRSPSLFPDQQRPAATCPAPPRRSPSYTRSLSLGEREPMVNMVNNQNQIMAQGGNNNVYQPGITLDRTASSPLQFNSVFVPPPYVPLSPIIQVSKLPVAPLPNALVQASESVSRYPAVDRDTSPKLVSRTDLFRANTITKNTTGTHHSNVAVLQSITEVITEDDNPANTAFVAVPPTGHVSRPVSSRTAEAPRPVVAPTPTGVMVGAMMTREPSKHNRASLSGPSQQHPEPSSSPSGSAPLQGGGPAVCGALAGHAVRTPRIQKARPSRKIADWSFKCDRAVYILGDSNLARIGSFQNDAVEIDAFPGATLYHFQEVMQKALVQAHVELVVLSIGLNNRDQDPQRTSIKQLRRLYNLASMKFPFARIYVALINFSPQLSWKQTVALNALNDFIGHHYSYLLQLPASRFVTTRDNIHWSAHTAQAVLRHWCEQLKLEINVL